MRICRFRHNGDEQFGFYFEERITPLSAVAQAPELADCHDMLELLPNGQLAAVANAAHESVMQAGSSPDDLSAEQVELLVPIPRPNKLFLLAGNYAKHIEEGGGIAAERAETFPYVFMKPPTTTLTDPGGPVRIPSVSPDHIDWELELAVVIGKLAKGVTESEALDYVAGYTVINDISDRKFQPNPNRKAREKDGFFDWLHGKWHDSFCPCGPCVVSADAIDDPQQLEMKLRVNGEIRQDATTAQQIFPVAAVIEFISSFVTLEPGDIISTGTAAGVGNTTGTYLKPGDLVEASIGSIGTLISPIEAD